MDAFSSTLTEITTALEQVKVRYAIGGSVASSARSSWRTTQDVDLVAAIHPAQVDRLLKALGSRWYGDADEMRRSIESGRSFNLIQVSTATKVDIFPATGEFHSAQLARATMMRLGAAQVPCMLTTAEDILLAKLQWYRDGGGVSDRQWNDIGALIRQNPGLDCEYINGWAARLGVAELLAKARVEAEL